MQTPDPTDVPSWITALIAALFGGGAVKMLSVWLENRRLTKKEYRQTLFEQITQQAGRISELETCIAGLQVRIGNLRVEVAHLEAENKILRSKVGLPAREEEQDHDELPPGESHAD